MSGQPTPDQLRALLPDQPRFVEARAALSATRTEIVEAVTANRLDLALIFHGWSTSIVVGQPSEGAIRRLADAVEEVIAISPESVEQVAITLPEWVAERAILHTHPSPASLGRSPDGVRMIDPDEIRRSSHLGEQLLRELRDAIDDDQPICASFVGEMPVAFCYAGGVTERWWDISIDTVEGWRRQGHASRCARYMIHHWLAKGKDPVWGAVESNQASLEVARKLGFRASSELWVVSAPE